LATVHKAAHKKQNISGNRYMKYSSKFIKCYLSPLEYNNKLQRIQILDESSINEERIQNSKFSFGGKYNYPDSINR